MLRNRTILHVAPHPDDEVLGAGGVLLSFVGQGWRVVNLACSLGRPDQYERRSRELAGALEDLGFYGETVEPPARISSGDDLLAAEAGIGDAVALALQRYEPSFVVSPHPHDGHHGHEVVGRAVRRAVAAHGDVTWWMWGLWRDLDVPTVYSPYSEGGMSVLRQALSEYGGENLRNRYPDLLASRATAYAVLGSERVFGYGSKSASAAPYADLLTEVRPCDGRWLLGTPRLLDPAEPHARFGARVADWWLLRPSVAERWRAVEAAHKSQSGYAAGRNQSDENCA